MKYTFASYATQNFIEHRNALCKSALDVGFDSVYNLSPDDFSGTDFQKRNIDILSNARGAGYWLWKPWLIRKVLSGLMPDDVLVYCDAGRSNFYKLKKFPKELINLLNSNEDGFLLGPAIYQHGCLTKWTKRDCLQIIGMDMPSVHSRPIIQATWSFWTPSKRAFDFLDEWIRYCEDPRCLTDEPNKLGLPNYKDFVDHRHDQSILTLLAYKNKSNYIDFADKKIFKILNLRLQSELAHFFLKRIDDAENVLSKGVCFALLNSFIDLKLKK